MNSPEQTLKQLKEKATKLDKRRERVNYALELAQKKLNELKTEAREKYGTDDIEKLKQILIQKKSDNEKKVQEAETQLESWEKKIQEAENIIGRE